MEFTYEDDNERWAQRDLKRNSRNRPEETVLEKQAISIKQLHI